MNVDVIPINEKATRHKAKRNGQEDGSGNGLGIGKTGDPCPTLGTTDIHFVAILPARPAEDLMHQSTLFAAEPLVSHSPSPDSEKDWMTLVATLCSPLDLFLRSTAHVGSYGKTSPAYCRATKDETLRAFWDSSRDKALSRPSMDGETAERSAALIQPTASPTACLTLNTREAPTIRRLFLKDEGVCSLSEILETGDVPQQYYLSAKACRGILRRAEKRGKELPPQLAAALQTVAESGPTLTATAD